MYLAVVVSRATASQSRVNTQSWWSCDLVVPFCEFSLTILLSLGYVEDLVLGGVRVGVVARNEDRRIQILPCMDQGPFPRLFAAILMRVPRGPRSQVLEGPKKPRLYSSVALGLVRGRQGQLSKGR